MEEPKITSGTVPYIASEIPDDPRDITPEQWEAMKAVAKDRGISKREVYNYLINVKK